MHALAGQPEELVIAATSEPVRGLGGFRWPVDLAAPPMGAAALPKISIIAFNSGKRSRPGDAVELGFSSDC
jgi:hypothetical protein